MLELRVVLHLILAEHLDLPDVVVVVPPPPPLPLPPLLLTVGPPAPVNPRVLLPLARPRTGGLVAVVEGGGVLQLLLLLLLLLGGVVDPPALHLSPGRHLRLDVCVLQDGDPGGLRAGARPASLLLVVVSQVEPGVVVILPGQVGSL